MKVKFIETEVSFMNGETKIFKGKTIHEVIRHAVKEETKDNPMTKITIVRKEREIEL